MNLREKLLNKYSRQQCDEIVEWVGSNQERFNELFDLFLGNEYTITQRSAWPVSYCVEAFPLLIHNKYDQLIKQLQLPAQPDAVKRNGIRLLQHVVIPEKYAGAIMDICFQLVESPTEAVAIKAFSLTVLGNLAQQYPEIIPEIKLLINDQFATQKPSFKSRAVKLLKIFK